MSELRKSIFGRSLAAAYQLRPLRGLCVRTALRLEGGQFYSATLRDILERYHQVRVGAYSYGECLLPGAFPAGVTVGRYVSMAPGVRIFLRNHPTERLSLHPFFYNRELGWVERDTIATGTLEIGHDAWLGERVIVTPRCSRIGIGAVVGAGAVVTKDVPDFGIVAGNPAKLVRFRFPEDVQHVIRDSKWWERPVEECAQHMAAFIRPIVQQELFLNPLLSSAARAREAAKDGQKTEMYRVEGV